MPARESVLTRISPQLLSSDRRGQAQSSLRNVKERHDAIQKIERQMVELAELFTDLDAIVVQQEPLVTDIERKGEEVHENVVKANVEIGGAIEKARSRNRKKWWCLLIVCKCLRLLCCLTDPRPSGAINSVISLLILS